MVKKIMISMMALGFVSPAFATPTDSTTLTQLLNNVKTFQANFSQVIQNKNGSTLQESNGKMALQRPGRFRWETLNPNQQLIIADGKIIWVYDKDLQEVTQKKQTNDIQSPGLLLSDSVDHLAKRYAISSSEKNDFTLTPYKQDLFKSVELVFDNQNNLSQMILHDNIGQTTQIQFTHTSTNQSLSPHLFIFRPPKNVDVIKG